MRSLSLSPGTTSLSDIFIPEGWQTLQLRDFCSFAQGGRLGLTKQDDYVSSGVRAFSAAGQDGYVGRTEYRDTRAVVLSAIGANCGRCFFAEGDWTTLANVQAIVPSPGVGDARFLFYRANRDDYWPRSGSAQPFIKPSDIKACWVALPPLIEQQGIAQILDTLDTTIRQTEATIEKLKQVKQGLLHDLLTRGIDANGELRPPRSEAPDLYKDSPLGWIPRDWNSDTVGGVIEGTPRNGIYKPASDIGSGVLLVGQTAFTPEGSIDFAHARRAQVSSAERDAFGLRKDDLLISRVFATREGVGQPVFVPVPTEPTVFESNMMRIRVNHEAIAARLLFLWLKHRTARAWIMSRAFASNQASVNREAICSVPVPRPSSDEQGALLAVERARESRLQSEIVLVQKLKNLKSGLMDDLLTGRVRVTPLLA